MPLKDTSNATQFKFITNSNKDMADVQACGVGATLLPLNVNMQGPEFKVTDLQKYVPFVKVFFNV
jgi:hypothetical protein